MGSRTQFHQLGNGLYVSGPPDNPPKQRPPTTASRAAPYTGGHVNDSGDLGKMFDITATTPIPSQPSFSHHISGSIRPGSGSAHQIPSKSSSGPLALPPTGLITSGERASRRPVHLDESDGPAAGGTKAVYGSSVTTMGEEEAKLGLRVSRAAMWVFVGVTVMGLVVGAFLMVAIKKVVIVAVVAALPVPAALAVAWSCAWARRAVPAYVTEYPDTELRGAIDGQLVKVTGVVTCGSIPLESSFQRVPRCVYVSTELYEYRGWKGKPARPQHRFFSWGCRHSERYVADFYLSDFRTGLRALVKTGYGAKVTPFVKPATMVDVTKEKRDLSPDFLQWLSDRKLSINNRIMRLKEGYVKEGSTVSVMGVVRRHENVLMIIPPPEPTSIGCRWLRCLLPMYVEGLILTCDDNQDTDVIPV